MDRLSDSAVNSASNVAAMRAHSTAEKVLRTSTSCWISGPSGAGWAAADVAAARARMNRGIRRPSDAQAHI
eukprot:scaffold19467_cov90-Isochrysis_galbana.AAC.1